tara:strand:+ start:879 stop:1172 length:294 start_codon:yes stop_codon:yes gene_type:complete
MPNNDEAIDLVIIDSESPHPNQNEDETMAVDPMDLLQLESVGNIQANNTRARDAATLANNGMLGAITRDFGELGTIESRANSGVMATPIAGPTTQQP